MTERFDLGTVLSVTTGRLLTKRLSPRDNGIDEMHRLLDHMRGGSHFTHMLPAGAEACRPVLLERFPELANADLAVLDALLAEHPGNADAACSEFLYRCIEGGMKAAYDVEPITNPAPLEHPVASLMAIVGDKPVVVVETEEGDSSHV